MSSPVPLINSLNPLSGPVTGGTQVTIIGQNFRPGCQVRFGSADAQTTFVNNTQLSVVTPPAQAAGPISLRVVNPGRPPVFALNAFTYLAAPPQPLAVSVLSPNGTEILTVGQQFDIRWTGSGASRQRVEYSTNGGQGFTPIATDLPGDARSFLWNVPALVPAGRMEVQALIRIVARSADAREASDTSNAPFVIRKPTSDVPPQIMLMPSADREVKRIAAGESATFEGGFFVRKVNGPLVDTCVSIRISPSTRLPPGVSVRRLSPKRNPSPRCLPEEVLTCREGETGDCGKFNLIIDTQLSSDQQRNTPPGDYTIGVESFCGICTQPQVVTKVFPFRVEKPGLVLSAEPLDRFIFAGKVAQYSIRVKRIFYTGSIRVESVFVNPLPPDSITVLPLEFGPNTNGNATETGIISVQTFAPQAEVRRGTPPGIYTIAATPRPSGLTPVDFKPLNLTLRVSLKPDADIAIVRPNEKLLEVGNVPAEITFEGALFRYNFSGDIMLSVEGKPPGATENFRLGDIREVSPGVSKTKFELKLTVPPGVEEKDYEMKALAKFRAPDANNVLQPEERRDKLTLQVRRGAGVKLNINPSSKEIFQRSLNFLDVFGTSLGRYKGRVKLTVTSSPELKPPPRLTNMILDVRPTNNPTIVQFAVDADDDTTPGDYTLTVSGQALKGNQGQEIDPNVPVVDGMATVTVKERLPPIQISFNETEIDIRPGDPPRRVTLSINKGAATGKLRFQFPATAGPINVTLGVGTDTSLEIFVAATMNARPGAAASVTIRATTDDAQPGDTNPALNVNILPPRPQPPPETHEGKTLPGNNEGQAQMTRG